MLLTKHFLKKPFLAGAVRLSKEFACARERFLSFCFSKFEMKVPNCA